MANTFITGGDGIPDELWEELERELAVTPNPLGVTIRLQEKYGLSDDEARDVVEIAEEIVASPAEPPTAPPTTRPDPAEENPALGSGDRVLDAVTGDSAFPGRGDFITGGGEGDPADEGGEPTETVYRFLADEDIAGLETWLADNFAGLSEAEKQEVETAISVGQGAADFDMSGVERIIGGEVPSATEGQAAGVGEAEEEAEEAQGRETAVEAAKQVYLDALTSEEPVSDLDLQTAIREHMPDGLSQREQNQFVSSVMNDGFKAADDEAKEQQKDAGVEPTGLPRGLTANLGAVAGIPQWVAENFRDESWFAEGDPLNQQMPAHIEQRLVETVNDLYGTTYQTAREVFEDETLNLQTASQAGLDLMESVVMDVEPVMDMRITLPGVRQDMSVTAEERALLQQNYGLDSAGIQRLARTISLASPGREIEFFDLARTAATLKFFGGQQEVADAKRSQDRLAQVDQEIEGIEGKDYAEGRSGELARMRDQDRLRDLRSERNSLRIQLQGPGGAAAGVGREDAPGFYGSPGGLSSLDRKFQQGLRRYNESQAMAAIYVVDTALARRVAAAGMDPEKLSAEDNKDAWEALVATGMEDLTEKGFLPEGDVRLTSLFENWRNRFEDAGGGRGRAGPVRRVLDDEAVRQQVRGLWENLFLSDPSEELIKAFTKQLQSNLDEAPEGMEFNVSARVQSWLEGQPLYQQLYRNKPEGMSEEEFQAQFRAGAASMLGAEAPDPDAIRAGMETGDMQTTVGRAFTQGLASGNNSTLQERLANAARAVASRT